MRPKLLPDTQRLVTLREQGLTHQQIAEWVELNTGVKVSAGSVASALSRAGKTKPVRYEKHLPWRVKEKHAMAYQASMLRVMGRRDAGQPISVENARALDSWLRRLTESHAVVAYVPESEEGFFYVDGDPVDGVPILPPDDPRQRKLRDKVLGS